MVKVNETIKEKISSKKRKKESSLYASAYELFKEKGINNTSIDEIVKKAGVAKGTFYLYFKDKYDVVNKLILIKSSQLITEAYNKTKEMQFEKFDDMVLYFIEYIINYFNENKLLLRIIDKNFSKVIHKNKSKLEENKDVEEIIQVFINKLLERGYSKEEANVTLFMIIELVGSVCYSSIIQKEPADISVVKPILFKKVKSILK